MKKSISDMPIGLLVSVFILSLIAYYGFMQISAFIESRDNQDFALSVQRIIDSMDYLKESNSKYGFLQTSIKVPKNQSLEFDSVSNKIILSGYFEREIGLNHNISVYPFEHLEGNFDYNVILCYINCTLNNLKDNELGVIFE